MSKASARKQTREQKEAVQQRKYQAEQTRKRHLSGTSREARRATRWLEDADFRKKSELAKAEAALAKAKAHEEAQQLLYKKRREADAKKALADATAANEKLAAAL